MQGPRLLLLFLNSKALSRTFRTSSQHHATYPRFRNSSPLHLLLDNAKILDHVMEVRVCNDPVTSRVRGTTTVAWPLRDAVSRHMVLRELSKSPLALVRRNPVDSSLRLKSNSIHCSAWQTATFGYSRPRHIHP